MKRAGQINVLPGAAPRPLDHVDSDVVTLTLKMKGTTNGNTDLHALVLVLNSLSSA